VLDETAFSITWDGRDPLEIGNRKEFRLARFRAYCGIEADGINGEPL
jgi:hypothetical protein